MPVNVVEEARHENHVIDKGHWAGESGIRESDEFKPLTTSQFMEEECRAFGWRKVFFHQKAPRGPGIHAGDG
jgi:hypothetical protein